MASNAQPRFSFKFTLWTSLAAWKHPKRALATKSITLTVAMTFLLPYLGFAFQPGTYPADKVGAYGYARLTAGGAPIGIAPECGRITSSFQGSSGMTVVYIQDLHCNYEVQDHLRAIVANLSEKNQLQLIGVEGESEPVDVGMLASVPSERVRQWLGDYFMRRGRITGPEYQAAVSRTPMVLQGIESQGLYDASRDLVSKFLNDENQGYVEDIRQVLERLKKPLYNNDLAKMDHEREAFVEETMTLEKYCDFLLLQAKSQGLDLAKFPVMKLYALEHKLPVSAAVDYEKLYSDAEDLERAIRATYYTSGDQRRLDHYLYLLRIMENMVNISATEKELAYYRAHKEEFTVQQFINFLEDVCYRYAVEPNLDEGILTLDESVAQAAKFYEVADKRSDAFVDNLLAAMRQRKQKIAVLITGGYHATEVEEALRRENVSYITVRPRITRTDTANPYFALLRNQRTPIERLLEQQERLFAPRSVFSANPLFRKYFHTMFNIFDILDNALAGLTGADLEAKVQEMREKYADLDPNTKVNFRADLSDPKQQVFVGELQTGQATGEKTYIVLRKHDTRNLGYQEPMVEEVLGDTGWMMHMVDERQKDLLARKLGQPVAAKNPLAGLAQVIANAFTAPQGLRSLALQSGMAGFWAGFNNDDNFPGGTAPATVLVPVFPHGLLGAKTEAALVQALSVFFNNQSALGHTLVDTAVNLATAAVKGALQTVDVMALLANAAVRGPVDAKPMIREKLKAMAALAKPAYRADIQAAQDKLNQLAQGQPVTMEVNGSQVTISNVEIVVVDDLSKLDPAIAKPLAEAGSFFQVKDGTGTTYVMPGVDVVHAATHEFGNVAGIEHDQMVRMQNQYHRSLAQLNKSDLLARAMRWAKANYDNKDGMNLNGSVLLETEFENVLILAETHPELKAFLSDDPQRLAIAGMAYRNSKDLAVATADALPSQQVVDLAKDFNQAEKLARLITGNRFLGFLRTVFGIGAKTDVSKLPENFLGGNSYLAQLVKAIQRGDKTFAMGLQDVYAPERFVNEVFSGAQAQAIAQLARAHGVEIVVNGPVFDNDFLTFRANANYVLQAYKDLLRRAQAMGAKQMVVRTTVEAEQQSELATFAAENKLDSVQVAYGEKGQPAVAEAQVQAVPEQRLDAKLSQELERVISERTQASHEKLPPLGSRDIALLNQLSADQQVEVQIRGEFEGGAGKIRVMTVQELIAELDPAAKKDIRSVRINAITSRNDKVTLASVQSLFEEADVFQAQEAASPSDVLELMVVFKSGLAATFVGNKAMLLEPASRGDVDHIAYNRDLSWIKYVNQVPAAQRAADFDPMAELAAQVQPHVREVTGEELAGNQAIYHGSIKGFEQSIRSGAKNTGKGFGGQGLYLALERDLADLYADFAVDAAEARIRNNPEVAADLTGGDARSKIVLEGKLNPNKKLRVAQFTIKRYGRPDLAKGELPALWADDPLLSKFMNQFDVLDIRGMRDAGLNLDTNRVLIVHENAGADAVQWAEGYSAASAQEASKAIGTARAESFAEVSKRPSVQARSVDRYQTLLGRRSGKISEVISGLVGEDQLAKTMAVISNIAAGQISLNVATVAAIQGGIAVQQLTGKRLDVIMEANMPAALRDSTLVHEAVEAALKQAGVAKSHAVAFVVEQALFPGSLALKLKDMNHYDAADLDNLVRDLDDELAAIDSQKKVSAALKEQQKANARLVAEAAAQELEEREAETATTTTVVKETKVTTKAGETVTRKETTTQKTVKSEAGRKVETVSKQTVTTKTTTTALDQLKETVRSSHRQFRDQIDSNQPNARTLRDLYNKMAALVDEISTRSDKDKDAEMLVKNFNDQRNELVRVINVASMRSAFRSLPLSGSEQKTAAYLVNFVERARPFNFGEGLPFTDRSGWNAKTKAFSLQIDRLMAQFPVKIAAGERDWLDEIMGEVFMNSYDAISSAYDDTIIGNALPKNYQGRVSVAYDMAREGDQNMLVITVTDNGVGQRAAQKDRKREKQYAYFGGQGEGGALSKMKLRRIGGEINLDIAAAEKAFTGTKTTKVTVKIPLQALSLKPEIGASKTIGIDQAEGFASVSLRANSQIHPAKPYQTMVQTHLPGVMETLRQLVPDQGRLAQAAAALADMAAGKTQLAVRTVKAINGGIAVKKPIANGQLEMILEEGLPGALRESTVIHEAVEAALEQAGVAKAHAIAFVIEQKLFPGSLERKLEAYDTPYLRQLSEPINLVDVLAAIDSQPQTSPGLKARQKENAQKVADAAARILDARQAMASQAAATHARSQESETVMQFVLGDEATRARLAKHPAVQAYLRSEAGLKAMNKVTSMGTDAEVTGSKQWKIADGLRLLGLLKQAFNRITGQKTVKEVTENTDGLIEYAETNTGLKVFIDHRGKTIPQLQAEGEDTMPGNIEVASEVLDINASPEAASRWLRNLHTYQDTVYQAAGSNIGPHFHIGSNQKISFEDQRNWRMAWEEIEGYVMPILGQILGSVSPAMPIKNEYANNANFQATELQGPLGRFNDFVMLGYGNDEEMKEKYFNFLIKNGVPEFRMRVPVNDPTQLNQCFVLFSAVYIYMQNRVKRAHDAKQGIAEVGDALPFAALYTNGLDANRVEHNLGNFVKVLNYIVSEQTGDKQAAFFDEQGIRQFFSGKFMPTVGKIRSSAMADPNFAAQYHLDEKVVNATVTYPQFLAHFRELAEAFGYRYGKRVAAAGSSKVGRILSRGARGLVLWAGLSSSILPMSLGLTSAIILAGCNHDPIGIEDNIYQEQQDKIDHMVASMRTHFEQLQSVLNPEERTLVQGLLETLERYRPVYDPNYNYPHSDHSGLIAIDEGSLVSDDKLRAALVHEGLHVYFGNLGISLPSQEQVGMIETADDVWQWLAPGEEGWVIQKTNVALHFFQDYKLGPNGEILVREPETPVLPGTGEPVFTIDGTKLTIQEMIDRAKDESLVVEKRLFTLKALPLLALDVMKLAFPGASATPDDRVLAGNALNDLKRYYEAKAGQYLSDIEAYNPSFTGSPAEIQAAFDAYHNNPASVTPEQQAIMDWYNSQRLVAMSELSMDLMDANQSFQGAAGAAVDMAAIEASARPLAAADPAARAKLEKALSAAGITVQPNGQGIIHTQSLIDKINETLKRVSDEKAALERKARPSAKDRETLRNADRAIEQLHQLNRQLGGPGVRTFNLFVSTNMDPRLHGVAEVAGENIYLNANQVDRFRERDQHKLMKLVMHEISHVAGMADDREGEIGAYILGRLASGYQMGIMDVVHEVRKVDSGTKMVNASGKTTSLAAMGAAPQQGPEIKLSADLQKRLQEVTDGKLTLSLSQKQLLRQLEGTQVVTVVVNDRSGEQPEVAMTVAEAIERLADPHVAGLRVTGIPAMESDSDLQAVAGKFSQDLDVASYPADHVFKAMVVFASGITGHFIGNKQMLRDLAQRQDVVRVQENADLGWVSYVGDVPAVQRSADYADVWMAELERQLNPETTYRATGDEISGGQPIYHGTKKAFAASVYAGPRNVGSGFGGRGLYIALEKQAAEEYAPRVSVEEIVSKNSKAGKDLGMEGEAESAVQPVVLVGRLNPNQQFKVLRLHINSSGSADIKNGILPVNWEKDPMLLAFIEKYFDMVEVLGAASAGTAMPIDRALTVQERAGKDAILWDQAKEEVVVAKLTDAQQAAQALKRFFVQQKGMLSDLDAAYERLYDAIDAHPEAKEAGETLTGIVRAITPRITEERLWTEEEFRTVAEKAAAEFPGMLLRLEKQLGRTKDLRNAFAQFKRRLTDLQASWASRYPAQTSQGQVQVADAGKQTDKDSETASDDKSFIVGRVFRFEANGKSYAFKFGNVSYFRTRTKIDVTVDGAVEQMETPQVFALYLWSLLREAFPELEAPTAKDSRFLEGGPIKGLRPFLNNYVRKNLQGEVPIEGLVGVIASAWERQFKTDFGLARQFQQHQAPMHSITVAGKMIPVVWVNVSAANRKKIEKILSEEGALDESLKNIFSTKLPETGSMDDHLLISYLDEGAEKTAFHVNLQTLHGYRPMVLKIIKNADRTQIARAFETYDQLEAKLPGRNMRMGAKGEDWFIEEYFQGEKITSWQDTIVDNPEATAADREQLQAAVMAVVAEYLQLVKIGASIQDPTFKNYLVKKLSSEGKTKWISRLIDSTTLEFKPMTPEQHIYRLYGNFLKGWKDNPKIGKKSREERIPYETIFQGIVAAWGAEGVTFLETARKNLVAMEARNELYDRYRKMLNALEPFLLQAKQIAAKGETAIAVESAGMLAAFGQAVSSFQKADPKAVLRGEQSFVSEIQETVGVNVTVRDSDIRAKSSKQASLSSAFKTSDGTPAVRVATGEQVTVTIPKGKQIILGSMDFYSCAAAVIRGVDAQGNRVVTLAHLEADNQVGQLDRAKMLLAQLRAQQVRNLEVYMVIDPLALGLRPDDTWPAQFYTFPSSLEEINQQLGADVKILGIDQKPVDAKGDAERMNLYVTKEGVVVEYPELTGGQAAATTWAELASKQLAAGIRDQGFMASNMIANAIAYLHYNLGYNVPQDGAMIGDALISIEMEKVLSLAKEHIELALFIGKDPQRLALALIAYHNARRGESDADPEESLMDVVRDYWNSEKLAEAYLDVSLMEHLLQWTTNLSFKRNLSELPAFLKKGDSPLARLLRFIEKNPAGRKYFNLNAMDLMNPERQLPAYFSDRQIQALKDLARAAEVRIALTGIDFNPLLGFNAHHDMEAAYYRDLIGLALKMGAKAITVPMTDPAAAPIVQEIRQAGLEALGLDGKPWAAKGESPAGEIKKQDQGFYGDRTQRALANLLAAFLETSPEILEGLRANGLPAVLDAPAILAQNLVARIFKLLSSRQREQFFAMFGKDELVLDNQQAAGFLSGELAKAEAVLGDTLHQRALENVRGLVQRLAQGENVEVEYDGEARVINKIEVRRISIEDAGNLSAHVRSVGGYFTVEGNTGVIFVFDNVNFEEAVMHEFVEYVAGETHGQVVAMLGMAAARQGKASPARGLRILAWNLQSLGSRIASNQGLSRVLTAVTALAGTAYRAVLEIANQAARGSRQEAKLDSKLDAAMSAEAQQTVAGLAGELAQQMRLEGAPQKSSRAYVGVVENIRKSGLGRLVNRVRSLPGGLRMMLILGDLNLGRSADLLAVGGLTAAWAGIGMLLGGSLGVTLAFQALGLGLAAFLPAKYIAYRLNAVMVSPVARAVREQTMQQDLAQLQSESRLDHKTRLVLATDLLTVLEQVQHDAAATREVVESLSFLAVGLENSQKTTRYVEVQPGREVKVTIPVVLARRLALLGSRLGMPVFDENHAPVRVVPVYKTVANAA